MQGLSEVGADTSSQKKGQVVTRRASVAVALVAGVIVLVDFFFERGAPDAIARYVLYSASVVAAATLLLGLITLTKRHVDKLIRRAPGRGYSAVLLAALLATLVIGFVGGGPGSPAMRRWFEAVLFPLEAALFSLLAFFFVTAIYRVFRIKNFESGLFIVVAIVVLLGQVPVGALIWDQLPIIKDWVFDVPALAGVRGILLGVGLGSVAVGLRVLLGMDRPYSRQ